MKVFGFTTVFSGLFRSFRLKAGRERLLVALWVVTSGAAPGETLTLATYNLANYNLSDRRTAEGYRPDYPKPESEKTALRQVIRRLQADVLVLQELGGLPFLEELQRDLRTEGCDYPYLVVADAGDETRRIGALSRRAWREVRVHRDLAFAYRGGTADVRRGLLELRLPIGERELAIFVLHLKSRLTERPDDPGAAEWRQAEAVAVRERILAAGRRPEDDWTIVAGDFNDSPRGRAVGALLQRGSRRLFSLVEVEDSRGERWTHWYRRDDTYSRVDHVLVSPALQGSVRSARIEDGPATTTASDHRPVVVTFEWE